MHPNHHYPLSQPITYPRINSKMRRTINSRFHPYLRAKNCSKPNHSHKPIQQPNNPSPTIYNLDMSIPPQWRECSWTESSKSNRTTEKEPNSNNLFGLFPPLQARTKTRRAPIILVDSEKVEDSRMF